MGSSRSFDQNEKFETFDIRNGFWHQVAEFTRTTFSGRSGANLH
jgi:hypothetical protein